MASAHEVTLVVSVDDEHLDCIHEVAAALESAGMRVERSMAALGTIAGSVTADRLEDVRATKGVADVEAGREFRLPPPDSPVQ